MLWRKSPASEAQPLREFWFGGGNPKEFLNGRAKNRSQSSRGNGAVCAECALRSAPASGGRARGGDDPPLALRLDSQTAPLEDPVIRRGLRRSSGCHIEPPHTCLRVDCHGGHRPSDAYRSYRRGVLAVDDQ